MKTAAIPNKAPRAISQQPFSEVNAGWTLAEWKMLLQQKVNLIEIVSVVAYLFTQSSYEREGTLCCLEAEN